MEWIKNNTKLKNLNATLEGSVLQLKHSIIYCSNINTDLMFKHSHYICKWLYYFDYLKYHTFGFRVKLDKNLLFLFVHFLLMHNAWVWIGSGSSGGGGCCWCVGDTAWIGGGLLRHLPGRIAQCLSGRVAVKIKCRRYDRGGCWAQVRIAGHAVARRRRVGVYFQTWVHFGQTESTFTIDSVFYLIII